MKLPKAADRLWRKYFGRIEIDDPRPIAEEAPYTFYLPSENELLAIAPGDLVKVIIRSVPPSAEWGAERMWVMIIGVDGETLSGELNNIPSDIPQLPVGSPLEFRRSDVIDIDWSEGRTTPPPPSPIHRDYWERCFVDHCVLSGESPVDYLYREEPDMAQPGDKYPDSGWRIRGDYRGLTDAEINARRMEYVALGLVLNADDSWLHLIDEPIGARFIRDFKTGGFVPESP